MKRSRRRSRWRQNLNHCHQSTSKEEEQNSHRQRGKKTGDPDRVNTWRPDVFGISDIHQSCVGLTDKSIGSPFGGPGIEMVASLGSTTDLDAVTSLSTIVLDDSHELDVALCGVGAVQDRTE
jgi:hypothetical protein